MPFVVYRLLAQVLLKSLKPKHIYAHPFLVLEWTLISWAEFLVDAKIGIVLFTLFPHYIHMYTNLVRSQCSVRYSWYTSTVVSLYRRQ